VTSSAHASSVAPLLGNSEPRLWIAPPRQSTEAGEEACRFYTKMTGRVVLPWQELAVTEILAERKLPDGRWKWAADDAGLVVARQNGKGDVLLIIELYFLFVLEVRRVFHTAQLQRTASDAHKRMATIIRNSPKLLSMLDRGERGIRYGKGDERIITADGREIIFFTRSDNAGRGLFGDLLVCDEGYDLTEGELAALSPLIKTSEAPLVVYASTPVDGETMPNGYVLSGVRSRALAGEKRMTWLEWSVPPKTAPGRDKRADDEAMWAMANPSMNWKIAGGLVLLDDETIDGDRKRMGMRKFLVEDLCAPDWWPDPEEDAEEVPFDPGDFEAAARPKQPLMDPVALGLDRSPDGRTALVAAGWHEDGTWGSETLLHKSGTEWVAPVVTALLSHWSAAVLVVDAAGPAGALVAKLQAAKLEPIVTGVAEMGRAAQAMVDDFAEGRYVPTEGDAPVSTAVEIARWRPLGDARAFARKGYGDISPLVAAALAGFGLNLVVAFGKKRGGAPAPVSIGATAASGADWARTPGNVTTIGF
jgi:PAS domain-containing protein